MKGQRLALLFLTFFLLGMVELALGVKNRSDPCQNEQRDRIGINVVDWIMINSTYTLFMWVCFSLFILCDNTSGDYAGYGHSYIYIGFVIINTIWSIIMLIIGCVLLSRNAPACVDMGSELTNTAITSMVFNFFLPCILCIVLK